MNGEIELLRFPAAVAFIMQPIDQNTRLLYSRGIVIRFTI